MIAVGFAIKSAIVPLHTWLPDAHGRAPSSVSAMLSGIVVQSALYALLKISLSCGLPAETLSALLIGAAILNMTLGNALALVQANTKRLLAYSTIAQVGYVMLGIGIGLRYRIPEAIQASFFLLIAHAAMKGLAFLCKGVAHFYCNATSIVQLRHTIHRLPLVAVAMSLSLAGLAGVPPLAGFAGKWLILTQFLHSPDWAAYVALFVYVLNGLVALGYYLPLIAALFASRTSGYPAEEGERIAISPWMALPIAMLGGLVLAIGLYPAPWLRWTADIGHYLLGLGG
jgi:formate hydrogenlyase subunit 3/multisubunit Na+/H+ antiporter MnhD subunit